MSTFDRVNFVKALCEFVAGAAGLHYAAADDDGKFDLWPFVADEKTAAATYTTVIPYDGSRGWVPVDEVSVQFMSCGPDDAAALGRSQAAFDALTDDDGRPLRMAVIGAAPNQFRINGVDLRAPGKTGADDRGHVTWTFNATFNAVAL